MLIPHVHVPYFSLRETNTFIQWASGFFRTAVILAVSGAQSQFCLDPLCLCEFGHGLAPKTPPGMEMGASRLCLVIWVGCVVSHKPPRPFGGLDQGLKFSQLGLDSEKQ